MDIKALHQSIITAPDRTDSYTKLTPGTYTVKVLEASYGKNQAGTTYRGCCKVQAIDTDLAGGQINTYLTVNADDKITISNIKPYYETALELGATAEMLTMDASDYYDIIQNLMTYFTRKIKAGADIILTLVIKPGKKEGDIYRDVYKYVPAAQTGDKPTIPAAFAPPAENPVQKVTASVPGAPKTGGAFADLDSL